MAKESLMYWRDYFHLKVWKQTSEGSRPYFEAQLQVSGDFSFEELRLNNFSNYPLTDQELRHLNPELRKILLRLSSFNSREFSRIAQIFAERILEDKETDLRFSTTGGGVYLFIGLLANFPDSLKTKTIHCLTSEIPLAVLKLPERITPNLHLRYRPENQSFMDKLPGLWNESRYLDLFEIDERTLKVS